MREAERENRMRKRKGMPLIEHADLAPSTQGWEIPETPVVPGVSMAEQFVQQRKRGKRGDTPLADETAETYAGQEEDDWTAATVVRQDDGWGFDLPYDDDTREH